MTLISLGYALEMAMLLRQLTTIKRDDAATKKSL